MLTLANILRASPTDIDTTSLCMLVGLCGALLGLWLRPLMRITLGRALMVSMVICILTALWLMMLRSNDPFDLRIAMAAPRDRNIEKVLILACSCVAATLGIGLLTKVYRAAVMDIASLPERSPGLAGVRAWLAPTNVITVVALAIAGSQAFSWDIFVVLLSGTSLLLIYPMIGSFRSSAVSESQSPQPPPEERQRILALLEAGRITADEAAELLAALSQSDATPAVAIRLPRRVMLLGAGVMLIGFFLPWFTEDIHSVMPAMNIPGMPQMPQLPPQIPVPTEMMNILTLRGGDVHSGLGWIALAAAIVAAIFPFFWTDRSGDTKPIRNITFAALGIGSVAVLYLLSSSFNPVTKIEPGFVAAIAAYVLLWIGAIREYVSFRPPHLQVAFKTA